MGIERFEDIEGWQLARQLSKDIHSAIVANSKFSKDRGLKDQITRAAGSAMDDCDEGFDSGSNAEFIEHHRT